MDENAIVKVDKDQLSLSRRSFIEVAIGTIAALPVVSGGLSLPFEEAHAAEGVIVSAKCDEIAVVVMDMAGGKRVPLEGAHVKVTSNFNNKTVEGDTDKKGSAVLKIVDLSEDEGKKAKPARYEFDAQVEVTKSGYRVFRTGRLRMQGARGVSVPTRKLEAGVPYPARVSFDDWDALYTDNEFCVTPKNDMRHSIQIELENVAGSGGVKVMLYAGNREVTSATVNPSSGRCTAELKDQFLMKGARRMLPVGENYSIRYEQNGKRYMAPLAMKTMESKAGFDAPGVNRNFTLAPFSELGSGDTHKALQISIPKGCPLIGGTTIQLWKPEFNNLDFGFDPFGFAYIAIRTSEYGHKRKNGKTEGNAWQAHPKKSFSEQYEKVYGDAANNLITTLGAIDKWSGFGSHVSLNRLFSATVLAQISLAAKWGEKQENLFRVRFGGQVILAINFSLTWQFLLGPVPMVFEFALNTSAAVGLNAAASTTKLFEWSKYEIDYTNSALSFTLDISPSISLGVGIKGALSVSVKGVLTVTILVAATKLPANRPKDVQNPHKVLSLSAGTFVVIQFLFFTIPFKLPFKINEPAFYDSWRGGYKSGYAPIKPASEEGVTPQEDESAISFEQLLAEQIASGEAHFLTEQDFVDCLELEYGDNGVYEFALEDMDAVGEDDYSDSFEAKHTGYRIREEDGIITISEYESQMENPDVTINMLEYHETSQGGSSGSATGQGTGTLMAGSSSALSGDVVRPQAAAPPLPEPKIAPIREYLNKGDSVVMNKVDGIASRTGLTPRSVEIFSKNALGDPHIKTFSLFGREFFLRIGSMKMKQGNGSPSVVARILGEGTLGDDKRYNFVFDFDPRGVNIKRNEYFDYNYDVCVREENGEAHLHFFVISGKRSVNDSVLQSLAYAAKDQLASYAHFKLVKENGTWKAVCVKATGYLTSKKNDVLFNASGASSSAYHNFSCPQIQYIEDTVNKGGTTTSRGAFVMTYLDRAAEEPQKIFSQKEGEVKIGFGMFCYDDKLNRFISCSTAEINQTVFGDHKDFSVFEVNLFKRCKTDIGAGVGWHVAMIKGGSYTYYYLVEVGALAMLDTSKDDFSAGAIRKPKLFAVYDPQKEENTELDGLQFFGPSRLIDWPQHDDYLASVKGRLVRVKLNNLVRTADPAGALYTVPEPTFSFTECGPQNFAITAFGVEESGRFLYYPAVREGVPGYRFDKDGNSKANKEIEEHDVMVCKLYGDKFSDPFVFCEVDYDMDTLVALCPQKSIAMSFLSSNLVDEKKSRAEIRYTAMPYVRCANVIGFQSLSEYAFPGMPSLFNLTIRNDGNVHLAGCTIRLHKTEFDNTAYDTLTKITFSKDTLVESNFNPKESDGTLKDVLPDYSLAPGKTSVYQVELTIPSNWNGKTWAAVTAQDFVTAKGSGGALSGQAAGDVSGQAVGDFYAQADYDEDDIDYVDYIVEPKDYEDDELEYPRDDIDVWYTDEVEGEELDDAPVTGPADDDEGLDVLTAGAPARGTGSNSVPNLSDSLGGLGLAAMGVAGAGAALAAYSRRRVENEKRAAAGQEGGDAE